MASKRLRAAERKGKDRIDVSSLRRCVQYVEPYVGASLHVLWPQLSSLNEKPVRGEEELPAQAPSLAAILLSCRVCICVEEDLFVLIQLLEQSLNVGQGFIDAAGMRPSLERAVRVCQEVDEEWTLRDRVSVCCAVDEAMFCLVYFTRAQNVSCSSRALPHKVDARLPLGSKLVCRRDSSRTALSTLQCAWFDPLAYYFEACSHAILKRKRNRRKFQRFLSIIANCETSSVKGGSEADKTRLSRCQAYLQDVVQVWGWDHVAGGTHLERVSVSVSSSVTGANGSEGNGSDDHANKDVFNPLAIIARSLYVDAVMFFVPDDVGQKEHASAGGYFVNDGENDQSIALNKYMKLYASGTSDAGDDRTRKESKRKRKKHRRVNVNSVDSGAGTDRLVPPCHLLLQAWRDNARTWPAHLYSFAVPSNAALACLAALAPVVEVGAGTGYWLALVDAFAYTHGFEVQLLGMDKDPPSTTVKRLSSTVPPLSSSMSASSSSSFKSNEYHGNAMPFTKIDAGTPEGLDSVPVKFQTMFLCYPPPGSSFGVDCLKHFKGAIVVVVGEWIGDTADERFVRTLASRYHRVLCLPLCNWSNTRYDFTVWARKKPKSSSMSVLSSSSAALSYVKWKPSSSSKREQGDVLALSTYHHLVAKLDRFGLSLPSSLCGREKPIVLRERAFFTCSVCERGGMERHAEDADESEDSVFSESSEPDFCGTVLVPVDIRRCRYTRAFLCCSPSCFDAANTVCESTTTSSSTSEWSMYMKILASSFLFFPSKTKNPLPAADRGSEQGGGGFRGDDGYDVHVVKWTNEREFERMPADVVVSEVVLQ